MARNVWFDRRPLAFAHQGGAREAPSNTLFAYKTAVTKGADALEMDLHMSSDGEIVICHDPTVDRTTNGSGRIDQMTLDELKSLDAAWWWVPGFVDHPDAEDHQYVFRGVATGWREPPEGYDPSDFNIPTLREVLDTFPGVPINMEIKQSAPTTKPYEDKVAAILREHGRKDDVIVASFVDEVIKKFRSIAPEITTSAATGEALELWAWTKGDGPEPDPAYAALQIPPDYAGERVVTPELVKRVNDLEIAVHVWTIDDEAEMEELLDAGAHGVMTDRLTVLLEVLARR